MLLLIAALALQPAADPAIGRALPPGTLFYGGPVGAADHEAIVLYDEGVGQNRARRLSLVRSGRWLREGDGLSTTHSDFESGTSVGYMRDEAGQYRHLAITRAATSDIYGRYRRERTGGQDRALGEACEIWRLVRAGDTDRNGIEVQSCETRDGIQLWTRSRSRRTGSVLNESRMLSFRRRAVRPGEVRPPADLLRWAYWRDLAPLGAMPAQPRAQFDYDLRLTAAGLGGEQSRILRRRGPWTYTESVLGEARRSIGIDNRVIMLAYHAEADGRPISLTVSRLSPEQLLANDGAGHRRLDPPESGQVIGETCFWSDHVSHYGVVVTSGSHRECLTADGLPLRVANHHRGWIANLTATALRRGSPPRAALMPPREAFDWARWGIRPAD
jgi:hypothetical protein